MSTIIIFKKFLYPKYIIGLNRQLIRYSSQVSEASTLILIAKNNKTVNDVNKCNYSVLMAKRNSKSSFMSNAYIFPGGRLDADDFSCNWLKIFGDIKLEIPGNRPPIITDSITRSKLLKDVNEDKLLDTGLALRIAAIRETYEETGILLSKSDNKNNMKIDIIIDYYRQKLLEDAISFSEFCIKLNITPDINSLNEWSNWTPPQVEIKKFNTLFFITFIDSELETFIDNKEVSDLKWFTPEEMLNNYYNNNTKDLLLAPPQVYELTRLKNITDFDELKKFSIDRQKLGLEQWQPIILQSNTTHFDPLNSEFIVAFPGDNRYNNENNSNLNRVNGRTTPNGIKLFVECNIQLPYGQLSPKS